MTLPYSGTLSIKDSAGLSASIQQEIMGNISVNASLADLAGRAGKSLPVDMTDFYGYTHTITYVLVGYTSFTASLPSATTSVASDAYASTYRDISLHPNSGLIWRADGYSSKPLGDTKCTSIRMRIDGGSWVTYSVSSSAWTTTTVGQYFKIKRTCSGSNFQYQIEPNNWQTPYGATEFEIQATTNTQNTIKVRLYSRT